MKPKSDELKREHARMWDTIDPPINRAFRWGINIATALALVWALEYAAIWVVGLAIRIWR